MGMTFLGGRVGPFFFIQPHLLCAQANVRFYFQRMKYSAAQHY
jgi:hypothetical protein